MAVYDTNSDWELKTVWVLTSSGLGVHAHMLWFYRQEITVHYNHIRAEPRVHISCGQDPLSTKDLITLYQMFWESKHTGFTNVATTHRLDVVRNFAYKIATHTLESLHGVYKFII